MRNVILLWFAASIGLTLTSLADELSREDVAKELYRESCWAHGQIGKGIANRYFSGVDEKQLKSIYVDNNSNAKGAKEAELVLAELGAKTFRNSEDYASTRYVSCLKQKTTEAPNVKRASEVCYRAMSFNDKIVEYKYAGKSEEATVEALLSTFKKGQGQEKIMVQLTSNVQTIFSLPAYATNRYLYNNFRLCMAKVAE